MKPKPVKLVLLSEAQKQQVLQSAKNLTGNSNRLATVYSSGPDTQTEGSAPAAGEATKGEAIQGRDQSAHSCRQYCKAPATDGECSGVSTEKKGLRCLSFNARNIVTKLPDLSSTW